MHHFYKKEASIILDKFYYSDTDIKELLVTNKLEE